MKNNFIQFLVVLMTFFSGYALAAHTLCSGYPVPLALVGTGGNINYPQNPALPKEILDPIRLNSNTLARYCTTGTTTQASVVATATFQVISQSTGLQTASGHTIFKLNGDAGNYFGYTIQVSDSLASNYKNISYINSTSPYTFINGLSVYSIGAAATIQLVLLKMPPAGVTTLTKQTIANIQVTTKGVGNDTSTTTTTIPVTFDPSSITANVGTCTVVGTGNYQINMLPVVVGKFTGSGTVISGGSTTISLTCQKSITPWATLTDVTDSTNTSTDLNLSSSSTATGVKVRLYKGSSTSPLAFGPALRTQGNTNQWQFGDMATSDNQVISITLNAKYVQTAATVTAGTVNAQSTITFSYQ